MIFITGDTHGDYDRFAPEVFPGQAALTKEDYVIICGDFGLWHDFPNERAHLDWLDGLPFTTLFIDGNHENYDRLNAFPVENWHGGKIHRIRPSILHLMRGQMFDLGGKRFFTLGGAACHDVQDGILDPEAPDYYERVNMLDLMGRHRCRVIGKSWWAAELPSDAEYQTARETLDRCGWQADYIITHCAPSAINNKMREGDYPPNRLTDFLEDMRQRCTFDFWFFGHYHSNASIGGQHICLYEQIIELPE